MGNSNIYKYKSGFTLFEVCVTMTIVAIFIAACSNVFTRKHTPRTVTPVHGHYECYRDYNGQLWEQMFNETGPVANATRAKDDVCKFTPPKYASYVVINGVAAGGDGGDNYGGSAGEFQSIFLSSTGEELNMVPGKVPSDDSEDTPEDIRNTRVYIIKNNENVDILNLNGGRSGADDKMLFKDCSISNMKYACTAAPSCTIDKNRFAKNDGAVRVTYCTVENPNGPDSNIQDSYTVTIPFTKSDYSDSKLYDIANAANVKGADKQGIMSIKSIKDTIKSDDYTSESQHMIVYEFEKERYSDDGTGTRESIKYFTLNIAIDGNYTNDKQDSDMIGLINSMGLTTKNGNKIADKRDNCKNAYGDTVNCYISTGDGGAINDRGAHGSVLISW